MAATIAMIELILHELLLFSAFWILVSGVDDICVDAIWGLRRIYRRFAYYRHRNPLRVDQLPTPMRDGFLAIFIPTWMEASVIGDMIAGCKTAWARTQAEYRIYIGCYPNDEAGMSAIKNAIGNDAGMKMILVGHHGPTTKADCLNHLWQALLVDELARGYKAKAVILHDAEDAVHRDELRLFNSLIEKAAAVQLPVIPVQTVQSRWISAHYCDEFAEAHGKLMVVREAIGASLPLAGVGCAVDRNILGRIAIKNQGQPFDAGSLTEDYELGLRLGAAGGRTIMARVLDEDGKLVAPRACFPSTLGAAVRQKARWLTGIALAGWDRIGWRGNWADKWMLIHDRRSIVAALVLLAAYMCILLIAILALLQATGMYVPSPMSPLLRNMLSATTLLLVWRMAVRAAFVWRLYGPKQAVLSIPRWLVANIIAIMAARRACVAYIAHCFGKPLVWDKTAHYNLPKTSDAV
jgi:bacteriophage N4 adsorption protein B